MSWAALSLGGFHPALALVPIVPFMPHSAHDLGLFDPREERQPDTLNRFEHWWSTPVQFVLLVFGFANAGVPVGQIGASEHACRQGFSDIMVVGVVASIDLTVSLFFATAAFPEGSALSQSKMGALLSRWAAPLALAISRGRRVGAASSRNGER